MIAVELKGGLGNQLFQYALGRSLAHQHQTDLVVDRQFLMNRKVTGQNIVYRNFDLDILSIHPVEATSFISRRYGTSGFLPVRIVKRFLNRNIQCGPLRYMEEQTPFQQDIRIGQAGKDVYLNGYWQSVHYFQAVENELEAELRFSKPIPSFANGLAEDIQQKQSVCVHVRRSDFVTNLRHNIIETVYYQQAERMIRAHVTEPAFYVFSDDIDWCRTHLRFNGPTVFVGDEYAGERAATYLHLMTLCHHFIIPNSTFSWWAAWLSKHINKVVIVPKNWVYDRGTFIKSDELVYPGWIQL
ncbi:alpha-1,2-fucosyltransferase [Larkinella punicea]|uniref:Alpha-1,2-fucosyltransferase n=1 Tax=Larkinella punicea TaxID=2315727 RepID=A0A368JL22_9BACT|nr:alpha-1,2-fucosyltransferase [Larkinella punicea]RCR68360.1 alpha-1,2-fucosyltransferase [Larkinella punicea]